MRQHIALAVVYPLYALIDIRTLSPLPVRYVHTRTVKLTSSQGVYCWAGDTTKGSIPTYVGFLTWHMI